MKEELFSLLCWKTLVDLGGEFNDCRSLFSLSNVLVHEITLICKINDNIDQPSLQFY